MIQVSIPYCGAAPVPAEWLSRWNTDLILLTALAIAMVTCWRSAEGREGRRLVAAAFAVLVLLYVSPLCALSSALFSVRVIHHVVLASIVAPLLARALPSKSFRGSLPAWTAAQTIAFWFWHAPGPYGWALSDDAVYWVMQLSLFASAFGFWQMLRQGSVPASIGGLLATMTQMALLGALLTFTGSPLYSPHFATTAAWGLSPLDDQQLAGLIMWIPASTIYLAAVITLLHRWLGDDYATSRKSLAFIAIRSSDEPGRPMK